VSVCRAHLSMYRALVSVCRAHLSMYRALYQSKKKLQRCTFSSVNEDSWIKRYSECMEGSFECTCRLLPVGKKKGYPRFTVSSVHADSRI